MEATKQTFETDVLVAKLEEANFSVFDCGEDKYAIKSNRTGAFVLRDGGIDDLRKYAHGLGRNTPTMRPLGHTDSFEKNKRVFRERESAYLARSADF